MHSVLQTGIHAARLQLPDLPLCVTSYTVSGSRRFLEQPVLSDSIRMLSPGKRAHHLHLTGYSPHTLISAMTLQLEQYVAENTSFSFILAELRFKGMHLCKYSLREEPDCAAVWFALDFLSTTATEQAEEEDA